MLAFHEQPEEIVTYDLHVVHLQLIEPLRDKAAHYRLIVGVGRKHVRAAVRGLRVLAVSIVVRLGRPECLAAQWSPVFVRYLRFISTARFTISYELRSTHVRARGSAGTR